MLTSLGYLVVGEADLDSWSQFATGMLGMQVADRSASDLALRMDAQHMRLALHAGALRSRYTFGFEVERLEDIDVLAERLGRHGVIVTRGDAALASQRGVRELVFFQDPVGNTVELFYGPLQAQDEFVATRSISGFRTGSLGLGHVVLSVEHMEPVVAFYRDLLDFKLSDYTLAPFKASFFHINARHHSLAFVETGRNGLHHLMIELNEFDDIGQAYDLAQLDPERIGVTLGRHSNDFMTSFYLKSPSPFMVEYGWGGRDVDPIQWEAKEYTLGPSLWGHERSWLTPEQRQLARELRMRAAANGVRAPLQVLEGTYTPHIE